MNLEQGAVYKNNERIELTALEYKILALFFENKGRILTRGQILSGIWDESGKFCQQQYVDSVYQKTSREDRRRLKCSKDHQDSARHGI